LHPIGDLFELEFLFRFFRLQLSTLFISVICATRLASLILLDLMTPMMLNKGKTKCSEQMLYGLLKCLTS